MYTLKEFLGANFRAIEYGEDFNILNEKMLHFGNTALHYHVLHLKEDPVHCGDCTNEAQPCLLCSLEQDLADYYKYTKDPEAYAQHILEVQERWKAAGLYESKK